MRMDWAGISVQGRRHGASGTPNQDACAHYSCGAGHVSVVCDGVGSCERSHIGSRAACLAVRDVVEGFGRDASLESLGLRVEAAWRNRLPGGDPGQFATTCLLAIRLRSGRVAVGGVGDGLGALGMVGGGMLQVLTARGGDFGETHALGVGALMDTWRQVEADDTDGGMWALLATDGLANDLAEDRVAQFATWLIHRAAPLSTRRRAVFLRTALRQARIGGGSDDQTVAIQWSRADV